MKMEKNDFIYFYFIFLFLSFYCEAQQFPKEIPIQSQPLQGTGIQRVGSAPIPIPTQNLELMALPTFVLPRVGTIQPTGNLSSKKMPYESTYMAGRIIFLNGVNISSVKNQDLENVTVRIDKNGNINIEAPQYEVGVEQSYHPLMPNELPKFPKNEFPEMPVPKGTYSKETGKPVMAPILPKEFAPQVPASEQSSLSSQNKEGQMLPQQTENGAMQEQAQGDANVQGQQQMQKNPNPPQQPKN